MDKFLSFLKSLPLVWRIVAFIGAVLVSCAVVFSSCVMFQSSASTDARGELDVSPSAHQRDTVVCFPDSVSGGLRCLAL